MEGSIPVATRYIRSGTTAIIRIAAAAAKWPTPGDRAAPRTQAALALAALLAAPPRRGADGSGGRGDGPAGDRPAPDRRRSVRGAGNGHGRVVDDHGPPGAGTPGLGHAVRTLLNRESRRKPAKTPRRGSEFRAQARDHVVNAWTPCRIPVRPPLRIALGVPGTPALSPGPDVAPLGRSRPPAGRSCRPPTRTAQSAAARVVTSATATLKRRGEFMARCRLSKLARRLTKNGAPELRVWPWGSRDCLSTRVRLDTD